MPGFNQFSLYEEEPPALKYLGLQVAHISLV